MAVPEHDRVTFSGIRGSLAVPLDDWSFSINVEPHATGPSLDTAGLVALATAARSLFETNLMNVMQTDTHVTRVRYAVLDGDGLVKRRGDGSYLQGDNTTVVTGTGGSTDLPLQCALVVSLVTARGGSSGRGRFFLPMPGYVPVATDKLLTEANATNIAGKAKLLLDGLNAGFGGGQVVVASSKGYLTPVTAVRVGRAIDTLRSRRSEIPEGYITAELA